MHITDKEAFEMIATLSIPSIILFVIFIVSAILLFAALVFYNKSRGVKEKHFVYLLIFLFCPWSVPLYCILTRKKAENAFCRDEDKKKYKIISVILAVMFALGFTADIVLTNSSVLFHDDYYKTISDFANFSYYDREGNAYERQEDVVYYTEDGCRFRFRTNGSGIISFTQMSDTYSSK